MRTKIKLSNRRLVMATTLLASSLFTLIGSSAHAHLQQQVHVHESHWLVIGLVVSVVITLGVLKMKGRKDKQA